MKVCYEVLINWQGEVHEFYRWATTANLALRYAIRELARKVGYSTKYVRNYVMDKSKDRWEVKKNERS